MVRLVSVKREIAIGLDWFQRREERDWFRLLSVKRERDWFRLLSVKRARDWFRLVSEKRRT